jgi:ribonucleotide reductase alpha subunit/predicted RNA-binding Zn-ribbon protein involved in translation (DUF1610 family)
MTQIDQTTATQDKITFDVDAYIKSDVQPISQHILLDKYAEADESDSTAVYRRVSKGLAAHEARAHGKDADEYEQIYFDHLSNSGVGAGRIMSVIGTNTNATAINCLQGDTVVLTQEGPVKIRELAGKTVNVYTAVGWTPAEFDAYGQQELFDVTFDNGQVVKATAGHDWPVVNPTNRTLLDSLKKVKTVEALGHSVVLMPVSVRPEKNEDYKKCSTLRIVSVQSTGITEEVFCANEPLTHTFTIEGGILTGNCYRQSLSDSLFFDERKQPSIFRAIAEAGYTMSLGGGEGYNFTKIRPKGANVKTKNALASGPCSYVDVFDASSKTIESAGGRRGANMGVLDVTHPDIMEFVTAKSNKGKWEGFNVSVGVYDNFMQAVIDNADWKLMHRAEPGDDIKARGAYFDPEAWLWEYGDGVREKYYGVWVYETVKAADLWEKITRYTYDWSEPGILFLDTANRENNLWYCESFDGTNPCVTADTRLHTQHGMVTVKELYELKSALQVTVDTRTTSEDKLGITVLPAVPVFMSSPAAQVYKVTTSAGYSLRVTEWHKFYTQRGKLPLKEMMVGDQVMLQSAVGQFGHLGNLTSGLKQGRLAAMSVRGSLSTNTSPIVPESVWQGTEECVHGFLSAIQEVNGSIETGLHLGYRSACEEVQRLFMNLGVKTEIVTDPQMSLLRLARDSAPVDTIVSIEKDGVEPVYDTTQADFHSLIFNGIVTGNCGEQFLPYYGCCDLGPLILTRFVVNAFTPAAYFDFDRFKKAVALQQRLLDNILDMTIWPLPAHKAESDAKRRIGIGYTGIGTLMVLMGLRYASEAALKLQEEINAAMRDSAYEASIEMAKERGSFPLFDAEKYLQSPFIQRLPQRLRDLIAKYGIRNSHLLSIAPTGTVSLAFANNAANGTEPVFTYIYNRKVRDHKDQSMWHTHQVADPSVRAKLEQLRVQEGQEAVDAALHALIDQARPASELFGDVWVSAQELSVQEHLAPLYITQPYIDSALSKTVNIPADYLYEMFKDVYMLAWKNGLKGVATYRPSNVRGAVLEVLKPKEPEQTAAQPIVEYVTSTPSEDLLSKPIGKRTPGDLPSITSQNVYEVNYQVCKLYLTISMHPVTGWVGDKEVTIMRPMEFFVPQSQLDASTQWVTGTMRTLSLLARAGGDVAKALRDYRKITWSGGPVRCGTITKADGSVAPRFHCSDIAAVGYMLQQMLLRAGYLDEQGEVVALDQLIQNQSAAVIAELPATTSAEPAVAPAPTAQSPHPCPQCGAHQWHRRDGCFHCDNCGHDGSCG